MMQKIVFLVEYRGKLSNGTPPSRGEEQVLQNTCSGHWQDTIHITHPRSPTTLKIANVLIRVTVVFQAATGFRNEFPVFPSSPGYRCSIFKSLKFSVWHLNKIDNIWNPSRWLICYKFDIRIITCNAKKLYWQILQIYYAGYRVKKAGKRYYL